MPQNKHEQEGAQAPDGMVNMQALGGPFGAVPQWKQPNSPEEGITQVAEYMKSLPKLIVCGELGLDPLPEAERRELLSSCNLFDALETVSRLQSRWDVAFTTTQRPTSWKPISSRTPMVKRVVGRVSG